MGTREVVVLCSDTSTLGGGLVADSMASVVVYLGGIGGGDAYILGMIYVLR